MDVNLKNHSQKYLDDFENLSQLFNLMQWNTNSSLALTQKAAAPNMIIYLAQIYII